LGTRKESKSGGIFLVKVYIFCQSEVGSGHYVRCNNIRKGLDDCNLQSISGSYTNEELKEVFAKQLKIINDYKPNVILLDGFPFMRYPWMQFGLDFILESVKDIKIVASVRDICYPFKGGKNPTKWPALTTDWANEYFDAILVHGDKNFIKLDESFEHLNLIEPPVYYTGYVTDPYKPEPQKRNGTIVSAGGGRVAEEVFDKSMELYDGTDWTFSVGFNHPKEHLEKFKKWASDKKKIKIVYNIKNFRDMLSKSELSISQSGYNTVMDLWMTDTPAKFIPYVDEYGEQEQTTRANLFSTTELVPDMNGVQKTKQLLEKICVS
jgi:predicted glycosyltransferase